MYHGIINVYKEKGYTSHDVVAVLRGIAGQKKIGHTGTLDPDAEGVLPVCLGKATKVCDLLTEKDKTYRAGLLLGITTDTQDITGTILDRKSTEELDEDKVRAVILSMIGEYDQIPPMYSALKVNGKKLYELAREGKTVERKARRVRILDIQILRVDLPRVELLVSCSKGTYIRTLCQDIGEKLGVGGCMETLVRTQSGPFVLEDSLKLEELQRKKDNGAFEEVLAPIDSVFMQYPAYTISKKEEKRLINGNTIRISSLKERPVDNTRIRVYTTEHEFAAIYRYVQEEDYFQIVKMFLQ